MKTKEEIIDETVAYYSEDPSRRAVRYDEVRGLQMGCFYLTPDGRKCAVGRALKPQEIGVLRRYDVEGDNINIVDGILDDNDILLDDLFLEEYQGHEVDFWIDLQDLHDVEEHWNKRGLTDFGKATLARMKKRWTTR